MSIGSGAHLKEEPTCKVATTFRRCSSLRHIIKNCPLSSTSILMRSTGKTTTSLKEARSWKLLLLSRKH